MNYFHEENQPSKDIFQKHSFPLNIINQSLSKAGMKVQICMCMCSLTINTKRCDMSKNHQNTIEGQKYA